MQDTIELIYGAKRATHTIYPDVCHRIRFLKLFMGADDACGHHRTTRPIDTGTDECRLLGHRPV